MNVDGINIKDIVIRKDSMRDVMNLPSVKAIENNSWWECDGIEPDLSAPKLAGKNVKLNLAGTGLYHNSGKLIELLSDGAYHSFNIEGRNFNYRLASMSDYKRNGFTSFSLTLKDDFPFWAINYVTPSANDKSEYFGDIDGFDLRKYGIAVLDGSISGILKSPDVKENLIVDDKDFHGLMYDDCYVKFKGKDIVLKCLMRANNINEFWQQRDNLLYDLIRPGEHLLYVNRTEEELPFYYKSCSTSEFLTDPLWWMFDLTLCVIRQRPAAEIFALGVDGKLLITNEDKIIEI